MTELLHPVTDRDHVRGPADAPVTLVEYGDVECPYCRSLEPDLRTLLDERADVRLVFRHFPLVAVHPHAYSAALALEAAAEHDLFWPLHDLLLRPDAPLGRAALTGYATQLGLPAEAILRPESERFDARVREQFEGGVDSGVEGTPTLFVNGVRLRRSPTLAHLRTAVDAAAATAVSS